MNTSKLHNIASKLQHELKRTETVSLIQKIIQSLEAKIKQPQQPAHQKKLTDHLQNLYKVLDDSPVNKFSPAQRDVMEELHVSNEFGEKIKQRIQEIFERNSITEQLALDEIKKIFESVQKTEEHLNDLINGLAYFGVGQDELEPDECEIGVIIPRIAVENNLTNFGTELVKLEKSLLVFSELATGQRESIRIRQISSSELSVFLASSVEIAFNIAEALAAIFAVYQGVVFVKDRRNELADKDVPEEILKPLDEYARDSIEPALGKIVSDLIEANSKNISSGRKNELKIELTHTVNKLANDIDRGFNFELRVSSSSEDSESENTNNKAKLISDTASKLEYLEYSGEPILKLPEESESGSQKQPTKKEKKS